MDKEKKQWIDEVLNSMEGSHRAKPSQGLFAKIERHIQLPQTKLVSMKVWRIAVAAAVLLLLANIFALRFYSEKLDVNTTDLSSKEENQDGLISDFNYYN